MKSSFLVLMNALALAGCAGKELNSDLESSRSSTSKIYGVYFTTSATTQQVQIVVTDGQLIVAKSSCSYQMVAAPSVGGPSLGSPTIGGPVSGKISCNDPRAGVKADFETLKSSHGSLWIGSVFIGKNPKVGGQYGCAHDDQTEHVLDCYYKAPVQPPQPGGGVSN